MAKSKKKVAVKASKKKVATKSPKNSLATKKPSPAKESVKKSTKGKNSQVLTEEIKIGNQIWMTKNLNVSKFRNGEKIDVKYLGDDKDGSKYGFLYHIDDVKDVRNIAPKGWRIPSVDDWSELEGSIGGSKKMHLLRKKEGWGKNVKCNDKEAGFNALLAESVIKVNKEYSYILDEAKWWSADYGENEIEDENEEPTGDFESFQYFVQLSGKDDSTGLSFDQAGSNFYNYEYLPIRLIKDDASQEDDNTNIEIEEKVKPANVKMIDNDAVLIGSQIWSIKNLNVTIFRNGDSILEAKSKEEWEKAGENGIPAWCNYKNKGDKSNEIGKIYNHFALTDPRGLAPAGWHIPTEAEWDQLIDHCGGEDLAGDTFKDGAQFRNGTGDNSSGLSIKPAGARIYYGLFDDSINYPSFWTSDIKGKEAVYVNVAYNSSSVFKTEVPRGTGSYIRCIKDRG